MLLIRPYPKATDTLPNYLLRLTAANGYKNAMQLLRDERCLLSNNRLPGKKTFFGDFDLDRVAMLANIETIQLRELIFTHTFSTRCLGFEQEFLTKTINFSNVRICPYCYQEQQSIPFSNSLLAKTFCCKHGTPLIDMHPDTGRKLTWATHYLWRDAPTWIPQIHPIDIGEAELAINEQLEKLTRSSLVIADKVLDLAEYCDLLEFFARFHQVAFGSSFTTKYELNSSHNFYAPAHWYIAEWPERYFELLNYFESHPMASSRITGVRKCFRDLYDDLYRPENKRSTAYKLLKSGFEQYLKEHYSNGLLMSSLSIVSDEVKTESNYISKEQVAKILGCRVSRVNLYVREGLLSVSKTLANGTDLFKRTNILDFKNKLTNCLSLEQCAAYLSISIYHARQLFRAGIIQALLHPTESNRDWLIERSEADKLVTQLIASACKNVRGNRHAVKRYTFSKVNFANLIKSMLSGEIEYSYKPDKKKPNSLMQFIPNLDDTDEPSQLFVSPSEAIKLLNTNKNAIYDFIKLGYLKAEKINVKRTPRPVKMISKASIANFKSHYLLRDQLNSPIANYKKLSGPNIDGCCVNLFSKL
ncbi:hypothetical protein tloyanaT_05580 [Thalassotalea loyana]|uniref:TniQ domain-containing protein n=1 Tax=Thalassotalea loyana TaxID=280483 RepID=A0ABQ6HCV1_9GAMM|nr:TniQ family protein [Thalassotalea loyana]GLX84306.1 hypothetical protein tloyanaT_05580 [Thalassotalea loyana]